MKEKVYVDFIFVIWLNWSLNTQTTWSVIQSEPETGRHKKTEIQDDTHTQHWWKNVVSELNQ